MADNRRVNRIAKERSREKVETKRTTTKVERNKESSKKDIAFKNTLIIALLIICVIETVYIVFYTLNLKENSVKKSFLSLYVELQKEVSNYLSNKSFELYDAYNYAQILTGIVIDENGEKQTITDVNGAEIVSLVSEEMKVEMGNVEYYVLNPENVKETLKVDIPSYLNSITWYIGSDGSVKIKNDRKSSWWTSDLECLLVGN